MADLFRRAYSDALGLGVCRPYLELRLTGPDGGTQRVVGLVDSGADRSVLPLSLARRLGYRRERLVPQTFRQVAGSGVAYTATVPCSASVAGLREPVLDLEPVFVEGAGMALWGRADFFVRFRVIFDEARQEFGLGPE